MKSFLLYTSTLLMKVVLRLFFKLEIEGQERIPTTGRIILAPNHQSNWDPPLVGIASERSVFFAAKRQLFDRQPGGYFLNALHAIPLDRRGFDRSSLRRMETVLDSGGVLVFFPEGTRSSSGELGRGHDGIGMLALQTRADLVPVYLTGTRGARPRIWNRRRFKIRFGEVISVEPFLESTEPRRQLIHQLSQKVMTGIRAEQTALLSDSKQ
jgi:1-acyl-sn-glycerol-3-phosphate acyltransferase